MKIPFFWLQSFFTRTLDLEKTAHVLTRAGLEVDSIEAPKPFGERFVVGKVLSANKHPNADRLSVCEVQTGKSESRTIVCGAPNVAKGQTVAVVLPGATLPDGGEIEEAEIRGVKSSGMICAADELGIGVSHDGILVLDSKLKVGAKLDSISLQDAVLDVEVTPNRPDWLSMRGVAREVAVLTKQDIRNLPDDIQESAPALSSMRSVQIAGATAMQYHVRGLQGISKSETPDWMIARLHTLGIESTHPVVDVTNYVLYEYGQPLHAFDVKKIKDKRITVRFAKPKETIVLLDDRLVTLTKEDIVIADASGPIALAGVMGGKSTAVTKETTTVLLEAALFPSKNIRKTSRRLGVQTDAANRFERGVTPDVPKMAINRAAHLIQSITAAKVSRGIVSAKVHVTATKKGIVASLDSMNALLGTSFTLVQAHEILTRLSFTIRKKTKDVFFVIPPVFRVDVVCEADVAEELARVAGYDTLTLTQPRIRMKLATVDSTVTFLNNARHTFIKLGYAEVLLPSFYGQSKLVNATLPVGEHRTISNPLDAEQHFLRSDLLPNMLSVASRVRKERSTLKLFEIGQVFWKAMRPGEHEWRIAWTASFQEGGEFIEVQQDLAHFISRVCGVSEKDIHIGKGSHIRDIKIDTTPVGLLALRPLKKGMTAACVECSAIELLAFKKEKRYRQTSKYPSVFRDISVIVPNTLDMFSLQRQLRHASEYVVATELFDVHPQSDATTSFAFHLEFSDMSRTLASQDVDVHMTAIERALQEKGGVVRS